MTRSENGVTSNADLQTTRHEHPHFGPEQRVAGDRTVPVYPPSPGKRRASALEDGGGGGLSVQEQPEYFRPQHNLYLDTVSDGTSSETASSATLAGPSPPHRLPNIDEQVQRVREIINQPLREKQRGYIVSGKWLARVLARSTAGQKSSEYDKSCREGEVGPIDNSDLVSRGKLLSLMRLLVLSKTAGQCLGQPQCMYRHSWRPESALLAYKGIRFLGGHPLWAS